MKSSDQKYNFATLAVDVAVLSVVNNKLSVLLTYNEQEPFRNCWALPGGLVLELEELESAIERVLGKSLNKEQVYYEQLHTFGDVNRDPRHRVVTVSYLALLPPTQAKNFKTEAFKHKFAPIKELPELAYDHNAIVEKAVERLKAKLAYTNIVYSLLPPEFTLSELQNLYEIILEQPLDKRNFRKKILSMDLVEKLPKKRKGEPNRPADLYRFRKRQAQYVEIL